jgi:hypothetical protein
MMDWTRIFIWLTVLNLLLGIANAFHNAFEFAELHTLIDHMVLDMTYYHGVRP